LLFVSQRSFDFGIVPPSGRVEATCWLYNSSSSAVELPEVQTSCECFRVTLEKNHLETGQWAMARVLLDLTESPQYRGKLRVEAFARNQTSKLSVLFAISATVHVAKSPPIGESLRRN
jgi:hypothetical protein